MDILEAIERIEKYAVLGCNAFEHDEPAAYFVRDPAAPNQDSSRGGIMNTRDEILKTLEEWAKIGSWLP